MEYEEFVRKRRIYMSLVVFAEENDRSHDASFVGETFGDGELLRLLGIKNDRRRNESAAGLVALKNALGDKCSALLKRDERGRPYFPSEKEMDLSISHSGSVSVAVLACGPDSRVGIDIEKVDEKKEDTHRRIANRYFSEGEQTALAASESPLEFYRIWTSKEARAKLTGKGLAELISSDKTQKKDKDENLRFMHFLLTYKSEGYVLTVCVNKNEKIKFNCSNEMTFKVLTP